MDDESDGVAFAGKWVQSYNANGGQCGDKSSKGVTNEAVSATYPLPVPKAGRYALKGLVNHLFNRGVAPIVDLTVRSGGTESRFEWNQYVESGTWRDLGMFELEPGATLELRPSPKSISPTVFADGFAIVPIGACAGNP